MSKKGVTSPVVKRETVQATLREVLYEEIDSRELQQDIKTSLLNRVKTLNSSSEIEDYSKLLQEANTVSGRSRVTRSVNPYALEIQALMQPMFTAISEMVFVGNGYSSPYSALWRDGHEFGGDILETYEGETTHFYYPSAANTAMFTDMTTFRDQTAYRWVIREVFGKTYFEQVTQAVTRNFSDLTDAVNSFTQRMFLDIMIFKDTMTAQTLTNSWLNGRINGELFTIPTTRDGWEDLFIKISNKMDDFFGYTVNDTALNLRTSANHVQSVFAQDNTEDSRRARYNEIYVLVNKDIKNAFNVKLLANQYNIPESWFATNFLSIPNTFPTDYAPLGDGDPNQNQTGTPVVDGDMQILIADRQAFKFYWRNGVGSEVSQTFSLPHNAKMQHFIRVDGTCDVGEYHQAYVFATATVTPPPPPTKSTNDSKKSRKSKKDKSSDESSQELSENEDIKQEENKEELPENEEIKQQLAEEFEREITKQLEKEG